MQSGHLNMHYYYKLPHPPNEGGNFTKPQSMCVSLRLESSSPMERHRHLQVLVEDWPFVHSCGKTLMRLAWKKTFTLFSEIGSHSHNQCVWTFETLEFIPISVRERKYCSARVKRSASYWLELKEMSYLSASEFERRENFELDCFPTVLCTVDSKLQRGHHSSRDKSIANANHSLITALTKTHLRRFCHFAVILHNTSCDKSKLSWKLTFYLSCYSYKWHNTLENEYKHANNQLRK